MLSVRVPKLQDLRKNHMPRSIGKNAAGAALDGLPVIYPLKSREMNASETALAGLGGMVLLGQILLHEYPGD